MNPEMLASLGTWGPILLMVLIFYFLLYRPQKKMQKRRQEMLDSLKLGARVVTVGGIYGIIREKNDKSIHLEIAKGVVIEVARSAINSVIKDEAA